jgi:hypothetical protein
MNTLAVLHHLLTIDCPPFTVHRIPRALVAQLEGLWRSFMSGVAQQIVTTIMPHAFNSVAIYNSLEDPV